MQNYQNISGQNRGKVLLYALSTCVWCRKTKKLLDELGVEYSYVDVDLLENSESMEAQREIKQWNPLCSFPTLVINDSECVVGYDEERIKAVLK